MGTVDDDINDLKKRIEKYKQSIKEEKNMRKLKVNPVVEEKQGWIENDQQISS